MTTYYLHTLDGKPAGFYCGQGVCFATFYGKATPLCTSLKQIRKEQNWSIGYRKSQGFEDNFKYGYRRVAPPQESRPKR